MINPQIALMGRQSDPFDALGGGLQMGQGLRQLLSGRQIGNMNKIDDENERKAFADKSMFSRELNAQIKADGIAKQKAMYDQLKTEAEIAKIGSEAGKNNAQAKGYGLDNSGKMMASADRALMIGAQTGDPMAVKLALNNALKSGAISSELFEQYNAQVDVLSTDPEAMKQFASGIVFSGAKDPASIMFTTADNRLDNQTSITNNQLTNKTSAENNERTTNASRYSTDVGAETADKNRVQNQSQFDTRLSFDQQQADIKNKQGEVKELGGKAYLVYKDGTYEPMVDANGQHISSVKSDTAIRTGVAELTGANDTLDTAIDALKRAQGLSEDGLYDGYFAEGRANFVGNIPLLDGTKESRRTQEYNNIIMSQALASLKATFGGSPTEGERAILLKIQASSSYPAPVRKAILNEAIVMAQNKKASNEKQMGILRGDQPTQSPTQSPQDKNSLPPAASYFE